MRHGAAVPLQEQAGGRAAAAAAQRQLQGLSLEAAAAGGQQPSGSAGSESGQPGSLSTEKGSSSGAAAAAAASPQPQQERLGCYFCNDVVAPVNSTIERAMDQQCTVARPGLSAIAGALAAELMAAVLQHPLGAAAPAAGSAASRSLAAAHDLPLGEVPHMIRGQLGGFSQMCLTGQAFRQCTACSPAVVERYRRRGADFLLQVGSEWGSGKLAGGSWAHRGVCLPVSLPPSLASPARECAHWCCRRPSLRHIHAGPAGPQELGGPDWLDGTACSQRGGAGSVGGLGRRGGAGGRQRGRAAGASKRWRRG